MTRKRKRSITKEEREANNQRKRRSRAKQKEENEKARANQEETASPAPKRIKMMPEEKRLNKNQKQRERYAKEKMAQQDVISPDAVPLASTSEAVPNQEETMHEETIDAAPKETTTDEQKRLERNRKQREKRAQKKLAQAVPNQEETMHEETTDAAPKQRTAMTDEEKRLERNKKLREKRAQKKLTQAKSSDAVSLASMDGSELSVGVAAPTEGSRRRSRKPTEDRVTTNPGSPNKQQFSGAEAVPSEEDQIAVEIEQTPSHTSHKNCKVRIGWVNLFDVETTAIVIPHYDNFDSCHLLKEMIAKFETIDEDKTADFIEFIGTQASQDKLNDYGAVLFDWNEDKRLRINRMLRKTTVHVRAPVVRNNQFTVVTEAHLRASYLSSLLEADKKDHDSISIPILGLGVCPERSAAIGIQTIFAYLHAVKNTNFELIYIITPEKKVYKKIALAFFYVREFDLNVWTTKDYLEFEKHVYQRVKQDFHHATIPGTDLVWRAFKVKHSRGEKETEWLLLKEIHRKMAKHTGIEPAAFKVLQNQFSSHTCARSYIVNGVFPPTPYCNSINLLDIRFNMDYFCGTNQVLRNLWIVSYYHMYFQEHSGAALNLDPTSEQYQTRKMLFSQLQHLHAEVIKVWNYTMDYAPYKCNCKKEKGYHENMMVFVTRLSYPDYIMDKFILDSRRFVLNYEKNEHFVKQLHLYQPQFIPRIGANTKLLSVANQNNLQSSTDNAVALWLNSIPETFKQQENAIDEMIRVLDWNKLVAGEKSPDNYQKNAVEYDKNIEDGKERRTGKLLIEERKALEEAAEANEEDERAAAMERAEKYKKAFHSTRYRLHLETDFAIERSLRNRCFRSQTGQTINSNYMPYVDPNDSNSDDDLSFFDEHIWKSDRDDCSIEEYIQRKLVELHYGPFDSPSADATLCEPYDPLDGSLNLSYSSDTSPSNKDQYPKLLMIGKRTIACPYCGALSFEGERTWSCCKSGSVWIPPIKRVPKEIEPIFQKKYTLKLIPANASFSMASIRYCRLTQAPKGIQSVKIKGMVSCHPSALHPRGREPAYANFIILRCGNNGIAEARYKSVRGKRSKNLLKIFKAIQEYLDKHNRLYDSYKSMAELEKHFMNDNELVEKHCIKFRIVPPDEINFKDYDDDGGLGGNDGDDDSNDDNSDDDDDNGNAGNGARRPKIRKLIAHKGVYAQPSRMGKGYITVAYTWDAESSAPIPRGMTIYPKNPKSAPQEPLSIYSEMCELMSYPLFFPDAIGGWGLHKFERLPTKSKKPTFIERVRSHLEELSLEVAKDYYELNDPEIRQIMEELFNVKLVRNGANYDIIPEVRNVPGDEEDEDGDFLGNMDLIEDDPAYFTDEQHEAFGELEIAEEAPVNPDDVGQRREVVLAEKGGELLPRRKTVAEPIPHAFKSPFATWSFGEDDENKNVDDEEEFYERGRHETHDEEYLGREGLSDSSGDERRDSDDCSADYAMDADDYDHYEGAEFNKFANIQTEGEDVEVAVGAMVEEEAINEEDLDVRFGDENNAEPNALARKNDGKTVKNVGTRKHVSLAEYGNFVMQDRRGLPCRFQGKAGQLGQLFLIDLACRIREMRMEALTNHRAIFPTATTRNSLLNTYNKMLEDKFEGKKQIGMLVTMPATIPGTSKYQRDLVMSAVTISNELGSPHLFITFTGNPKWPEIKEECAAKQCEWADIPDFVNRVFKRRYEIFLEDVVGKQKKSKEHNGKYIRQPGIFGPVVWYNYSVEFQQRGMPHCHLLLCLENPITNAAQIDEIISAEVPDYPDISDPLFEDKLLYYNLVMELMVHMPCKGDGNAYCNKGKQEHWKLCGKGFPKLLTDHTILSDNQYPDYRRTTKNVFRIKRKNQTVFADSSYVVAHNKYLLMKHQCHINVESVSSIKTMKYMFKYIHKGCDRVLLEAAEQAARGTFASDSMTLDRNVFVPKNLDAAKVRQRQEESDRLMRRAGVSLKENDKVAMNECHYLMDMSIMTPNEAAWRIAGFLMHGCSHTVLRSYVHEEGRDVMYVNRGVSAAQAGEMLKKRSRGMMAAWFEANQNPVVLPKKDPKNKDEPVRHTTDLTLDEMVTYYKFDTKEQEFIFRGKDWSRRILGRIQAPQPKWLELTATRLLALNVRGPKSWEDLRHYRGTTYPTCLEAARARGLMDGDIEWHLALTEIGQTKIPVECRRFFVSILVHCAPANPRELWDGHWKDLVNNKQSWTAIQKRTHALRQIMFLLRRHGFELKDFELGDLYDKQNEPRFDRHEDIENPEAVKLNDKQHQEKGKGFREKLNKEQREFVDRAYELGKSKKKQKRMLFVDGPGGTGKTYCYKTIYHLLSGKQKKVVCVSHTGVAACLLPNGCTAHRKFSMPLEVSDRMSSNITFESVEGQALALTDCIIWDEICMTDHRIIDAVDRLFQMLKNNTLPFGGVLMIMGGDWRQILPIVAGVPGFAVARYTLKNDNALWPHIEKFRLTQNKRAEQDPDYAKRILDIGDGANYLHENRKMVFIPEENIERRGDRALAEWVFPDVNKPELSRNAALLTVDNRTALRLNEIILDRLTSQPVREFLSTDTADKDDGLAVDPAIFASETPSGLPPHRLRLKVGAQVVLLRNISVEQGLCNGTRLTILKFGDDIIHCVVNNPTENSPPVVYLHRMLLSPTGKGAKSCGFKRLQYPFRLAYAMTINKSQGQTLDRCGLVLHSQVFAHGQLYVAMSRVQKSVDFKLWHCKRKNNPQDDCYGGIGMLVRNIVYRDILRDDAVKDILESLAPPKDNSVRSNVVVPVNTLPLDSSSNEERDARPSDPLDLSVATDPVTSGLPAFFRKLKKRPKTVQRTNLEEEEISPAQFPNDPKAREIVVRDVEDIAESQENDNVQINAILPPTDDQQFVVDEATLKPGIFKRLKNTITGLFNGNSKKNKAGRDPEKISNIKTFQNSSKQKIKKKVDQALTKDPTKTFARLFNFDINEARRFDGSTSFLSWVRWFDHCLRSNKKSEKQGLKIIPWLLSGEAIEIYESLPETLRKDGPIHMLFDQFHKAIYSEHVQAIAKQEIEKLKSEERTVISEKVVGVLFHTLESVVEKSLPGISDSHDNERDAILKNTFIYCLPLEIRKQLIFRNFENSWEAMDKAVGAALLWNHFQHTGPSGQNRFQQAGPSGQNYFQHAGPFRQNRFQHTGPPTPINGTFGIKFVNERFQQAEPSAPPFTYIG